MSAIIWINVSEDNTVCHSLTSIMTIKERAGQVRGALNGAFARKQSSQGQYTAIENYLNSGKYSERAAMLTMPSEYLTLFNDAKQNPIWKQVEEIQEQYLAQKNGSSRFSGESRFDFQKEVVRVSVAIPRPFDKLYLVIDTF